jgi:hypothetical protein
MNAPKGVAAVECLLIVQEHDADLKDTCDHQDNSEADIYVSKSRAAPIERPVEFLTLFAHACLLN